MFDNRWRDVTARAEKARVVLLAPDGSTVDELALADVDTITIVGDKRGKPNHLLVGRKAGRALLFAVRDEEDQKSVARALGLALAVARSRYRAQSRAFVLFWPACLGTARPSTEGAGTRRRTSRV